MRPSAFSTSRALKVKRPLDTSCADNTNGRDAVTNAGRAGASMDISSNEYVILHPDPAVGKVLRGILRESGAQTVRVLQDGRDVLDLVRGDKGDVLLVDERLCGPDHWPLVRNLRQIVRKRAGPVAILMTSAPTRHMLEAALREGYASMIAVPFSVRTFTAHVERAFSTSPEPDWDLADKFLVD